MPITGKKCSFTVMKEVEGNKKEVPARGEVLGEPMMKKNGDNQYMVVPVMEETGQLHEIGLYRLQVDVK